MARLGELLVEEGACTEGAVHRALQNQAIFGGRLGTNLLELGAISEEALAFALGRQSGAPALYGDLPFDVRALRLVDRRVADRWDVVPYIVAERKLAVLARDPHDLRMLDDVAFASGRTVHPFIVPEARIWQALRRAYGIDREHRGFGPGRQTVVAPPQAAPAPSGPELMDEAEFQALYGQDLQPRPDVIATPVPGFLPAVRPSIIPPPGVVAPAARPAPAPPPPTATPAPGGPATAATPAVSHPALLDLSAQPPPLSLDAIEWTPGHAPPPEPPSSLTQQGPPTQPGLEPPEPSPLSFAEAMRFLEGVRDRGTIARTVLRHARARFRRALLFTIRGGEAHGWAGQGEGLTPEAVHALRLPLGVPGVVDTVVATGAHYLGPLPKTWSNIRLLKGIGGGVPKNALLLPITVRGAVVNVLYADDGRGGLVDASGVGELLVLAARIAHSYDALAGRAV